jgi:hypothetical protein
MGQEIVCNSRSADFSGVVSARGKLFLSSISFYHAPFGREALAGLDWLLALMYRMYHLNRNPNYVNICKLTGAVDIRRHDFIVLFICGTLHATITAHLNVFRAVLRNVRGVSARTSLCISVSRFLQASWANGVDSFFEKSCSWVTRTCRARAQVTAAA